MKKILFCTTILLMITGCTRLITAPMSITGSSVGTAIEGENATEHGQ